MGNLISRVLVTLRPRGKLNTVGSSCPRALYLLRETRLYEMAADDWPNSFPSRRSDQLVSPISLILCYTIC